MKLLLKPWGLLALALLVCLPPMLIGLGDRDSTHTMENIAVLSSQETWLRQHGYLDIEPSGRAWLLPTRNGRPRINKPPMLVWLHLLAWSDLDPKDTTPTELILRARGVAVLMGCLVMAGVYWAGLSLGGRRLALVAALVCGTTWFLQRQARTASYDIHMTAWVTISLASALWAMRPIGKAPSNWRWIGAWLLAAVMLGAGFMTKAMALVVAGLPMVCFVLLIPKRRLANLMAMIAVLLITLCMAVPWYVYAALDVQGAVPLWIGEFRAKRPEFQPPWYYLGLLGLIAPWSLWLVAGLFQPFVRARGARRRRLLIPWLWFVAIFVFFSIPGAKQQRYILPIVPAASLLIATVWDYHQRLARRGKVDQGVNLLRMPHWVGLLVFSALLAPFLLGQNWMVEWGWFAQQPIGPFDWWLAVPGSLLLVFIAAVGGWWHAKWQPFKAALATVAWALLCTTMIWSAYSDSETGIHPIRGQAERISATVGNNPLVHLRLPMVDNMINEEFLLYAKRIVPSLNAKNLQERMGSLQGTVYLMARASPRHDRILTSYGWEQVTEFRQDHRLVNRLWIYRAEPEEG